MKALELADALEKDTADELLCQSYCDHMIDAASELRRLAAVETDCARYLKEGETPAERIKRALADTDSLMTLYRAVTAERDALKADLEGRYKSIIDMGNMLTEIVNLIRGEPEEGTSHSTHDAVDLVRGLSMHNDLYATAVELEMAKLKAENERLLAANRDCIAHYEDARAELERIKSLPPVAWEVYVADADNAYVVESLDDPQLIDDCTNSDAVVTPLIALGSKK